MQDGRRPEPLAISYSGEYTPHLTLREHCLPELERISNQLLARWCCVTEIYR